MGGARVPARAGHVAVAALALLACACATTGDPLPVENAAEARSLNAGADAERRGDLEGALVDYVKALAENPDSAEGHFRVARVHSALGNRATASDAYRRTLKLKPDHVGALEGLGLLMLDEGKHDAAQELLHKAAAKDARRWATYNGLGVLADLAGKHALARAYFGHALTLQPRNPLLLNNLGYSHYLVGEYDTAKGYFERTLALEPGNRNAWSNLALVHTRRGQYDQAIQAMEKIMDAPSARYSVGYVCMLDGKLADAERLFVAAIKTSTSYNPVAQAALKRVREEQARANGGAKF